MKIMELPTELPNRVSEARSKHVDILTPDEVDAQLVTTLTAERAALKKPKQKEKRERPFGSAQKAIRAFLWDHIEATGHSPRCADIADATGVGEGNVGTVIRTLQFRNLVVARNVCIDVENHHGQMTRGSAIAVLCIRRSRDGEEIWVRNPDAPFDGMTTQRRCMCCAKYFQSRHKFNRLCDACKADGDVESSRGADSYGMGYVSNGAAIAYGKIGGWFLDGRKG